MSACTQQARALSQPEDGININSNGRLGVHVVVDSGYVLVAIKNTVSFNLLGLVGVVGKNGVAVFTLSAISNSIIIKPY